MIFSALVKSSFTSFDTLENFSFSYSSRTKDLTTRMPLTFSCTELFIASYFLKIRRKKGMTKRIMAIITTNRNHHHKDERQLVIEIEAHDKREQEHQRNAHGDSYAHLIGVLYVRDVRRQPRDERGRGKLIHVREREALHGIKQILSQIFRKAAARGGGKLARHDAAEQGQSRQHEQNGPVF